MSIGNIIKLLKTVISGAMYKDFENAMAEHLDKPYMAFLKVFMAICAMIIVGFAARMINLEEVNILFGFVTVAIGGLTVFYHRHLIKLLTASVAVAVATPMDIKSTATAWIKNYISIARYSLGFAATLFFLMGVIPKGDSEGSFLVVILGVLCLALLPKTEKTKKA